MLEKIGVSPLCKIWGEERRPRFTWRLEIQTVKGQPIFEYSILLRPTLAYDGICLSPLFAPAGPFRVSHSGEIAP
jgi:hypothetical protein